MSPSPAPKGEPADAKARTLRFDCTGTIRPAGGQLTFQGPTTTAPTKEVAITGGTGRY